MNSPQPKKWNAAEIVSAVIVFSVGMFGVAYALHAPTRYDLYLHRANLPVGAVWGLIWMIANAIILILSMAIGAIPAFLLARFWILRQPMAKTRFEDDNFWQNMDIRMATRMAQRARLRMVLGGIMQAPLVILGIPLTASAFRTHDVATVSLLIGLGVLAIPGWFIVDEAQETLHKVKRPLI